MVHSTHLSSLEAFLYEPRFRRRARFMRAYRLAPVLALASVVPLVLVNPLAGTVLFLCSAYYFTLLDHRADWRSNRAWRMEKIAALLEARTLQSHLAPGVLAKLEDSALQFLRSREELRSVAAFDPALETQLAPLLEGMMMDAICGAFVGLQRTALSPPPDDSEEASGLAVRLIEDSDYRLRNWMLVAGSLHGRLDNSMCERLKRAADARTAALSELGYSELGAGSAS